VRNASLLRNGGSKAQKKYRHDRNIRASRRIKNYRQRKSFSACCHNRNFVHSLAILLYTCSRKIAHPPLENAESETHVRRTVYVRTPSFAILATGKDGGRLAGSSKHHRRHLDARNPRHPIRTSRNHRDQCSSRASSHGSRGARCRRQVWREGPARRR